MPKAMSTIRVRYQETDQMGVVYHANYLVWMELGRTQLIKDLGFNYAAMESDGIISPVIDLQVQTFPGTLLYRLYLSDQIYHQTRAFYHSM